jgi:CelD/BcsL family acetyltransferase involved in cellulose biosynthesis
MNHDSSPTAGPGTLRSEVVTCPKAFATLSGEWDQLVGDSGRQGYFMRWRWNFLWWEHLAPAQAELRLVICRTSDGTLVGLAPIYLRIRKAFGIVKVRELLLLGTGVSLKTAEYLDVVTRAGYERTGAVSMANALIQMGDWDRIWCSRVPDDSPVMAHFIAALNATAVSGRFDEAPYIDTSRGWDAYKRSLGRSMRRNVAYYARRLFQSRPCEFKRVQAAEELDVAFDALIKLHTAQWQSKKVVGSLSNDVFATFLRSVAHESLADKRLRLWTLKVDGTIEAVLLGFLDGGIVHYFQKGHNPAFAKDDLGTALVSLCVRDCCEDPEIRAFDFMGGGAPYKRMWAKNIRTTTVTVASSGNARARAFEWEQQLRSASTAFYRAVMPAKLRSARRDWLHGRALRANLRRAGQLMIGFVVNSVRAQDYWCELSCTVIDACACASVVL